MDNRFWENSFKLGTGNTRGWSMDGFGTIRDELGCETGFRRFGPSGSPVIQDPFLRLSLRPSGLPPLPLRL